MTSEFLIPNSTRYKKPHYNEKHEKYWKRLYQSLKFCNKEHGVNKYNCCIRK